MVHFPSTFEAINSYNYNYNCTYTYTYLYKYFRLIVICIQIHIHTYIYHVHIQVHVEVELVPDKKVWCIKNIHRKFHPVTLSYQSYIPTAVSCQGHIPVKHLAFLYASQTISNQIGEGVKIEAREVLQ